MWQVILMRQMDNFMIKSLFPVEFCYVLRYIVMLDNVWAWTHITNRQCSELTCCVVYGVLLLLVVTCHSNAFQKVSQSRCCRHLRHVILFQKVWNYCIPLASQPNAMSSTQWQKESQHNSAQISQWSCALEDNVLQNEPSYNWAPLWIRVLNCNSMPWTTEWLSCHLQWNSLQPFLLQLKLRWSE